MRLGSKVFVALGSFLIACAPLPAQSLKDSRFTDPATLIQNKKVQEHLDLDAATVQKVFQVPIHVREVALADFKALANVKDPAEHERQKQELKKRTIKAGVDELAKILEPGDFKRLQQIALQMADYQAFTTKDVKTKLDLTPEQDDRIKSIVEVGNKDVRELVAGANVRAGDMEVMWKVSKPARKRAMENIVAVLTPDQRKNWESMVGEEFDFALDRPGRDDAAGISMAVEQMGLAYWHQGEHELAHTSFEHALETAAAAENARGVIHACNDLAGLHWERGEFPEALERVREGLRAAEEIGYRHAAGVLIGNAAEIFRLRGGSTRRSLTGATASMSSPRSAIVSA